MDKFSVTLPLTGEYLTTVRLTTGGLCSLVGFDLDAEEDYKVCVTESLLLLKRNGFSTAYIVFSVAETLGCEVCGEGERGEKTDEVENEISYALLRALLGEVEFARDEKGLTKIAFEG